MGEVCFQKAIREIKVIEGVYSDHPDDTGGKTKFGITERLARNYGYEGEMKDLSWDFAEYIYKKEYWFKNHYDKIDDCSIAVEMMEQAINLPYIEVNNKYVLKANYHLQKSYNYASLKKDITVDGLIGPQTLGAINNCDEIELLYKFLNGFQAKHYLDLADKYEAYLSFIRGWFNQRIDFRR